tara:strand:+ start:45 stop:1187 length:1143 start_codon:yes stop_codon:yes gene_type:complete
MRSIVNKLKALKGNIFGTGGRNETRPPASIVQDIGLQESPTGLAQIDPLGFSTLAYPYDVQNSFQNGHYMLFYVNVQNRTKYVYPQADTIDVNKYAGALKGVDGRESAYEQLKKIRQSGPETGNPDADKGSQMQQSKPGGNDVLGVGSLYNSTRRISDSVSMYLPANIEDTTSAAYNDSATGIVGFLAASGELGKVTDRASMARLIGGTIKGLGSDITAKAVGAIGDVFGAEGTEQLIKKAFGGNADNPYMEVLFDAMQLRTFTYNFQFAPRSEEEAIEVQKIIQLFRFHMAPELRPGTNRYLGLPSQFDIHYMYLTKEGVASENNFYNKIATCVLQDCKINYAPDGVKSFADGGPVQTTMALTFKETELLTKDKIAKGF